MHKETREASIFLALTIILSYFVFWGPIALWKIPTANLTDGAVGPIWAIALFVMGGFVPSIAGIALTAIYEGKEAVRELLRSSFSIRIKTKWLIMMVAVSLYIGFSWIAIYLLLGGSFDYSQFLLQLPLLIPLIILGPISEEIGWRGFAIKRLLKHWSPNTTSLVIGIAWALWHFPLFHVVGTTQYELSVPFMPFFISVTSISFVYTYFYIQTKGNVFSAIFLHWMYTYVASVVWENVVRTPLFNWLEFLPTLLIGFVFAVLLNSHKDLPVQQHTS